MANRRRRPKAGRIGVDPLEGRHLLSGFGASWSPPSAPAPVIQHAIEAHFAAEEASGSTAGVGAIASIGIPLSDPRTLMIAAPFHGGFGGFNGDGSPVPSLRGLTARPFQVQLSISTSTDGSEDPGNGPDGSPGPGPGPTLARPDLSVLEAVQAMMDGFHHRDGFGFGGDPSQTNSPALAPMPAPPSATLLTAPPSANSVETAAHHGSARSGPNPSFVAVMTTNLPQAEASPAIASSSGARGATSGPIAPVLPIPPDSAPDRSAGAAISDARTALRPVSETSGEPGSEIPDPRGSDLLADFVPGDRGALEQAVDRFLDGLDDLGMAPSWLHDASGAIPAPAVWAAAIVALELGRRQWKRLRQETEESADRPADPASGLGFAGWPGSWSARVP